LEAFLPIDEREMVADRTTEEYHLTPRGWEPGTSYYFHHPEQVIEPPPDRIETWCELRETASAFSQEYVEWKRIWTSPLTEEERVRIRKSFPKPG
jgi:hypothetical protein